MAASLCLPGTQARICHNAMSIGLRKDWDEYLQKCLCRIPPGPPTSVIIKKITESPMDSRAPTPKKGQTMLAIKGFTPLVLALLAVAEPSLGFIQKGTLVVPYIRDFNPLILPKPIQGISGASSPKALEATFAQPSHHQSKDVLPSAKFVDLRRHGYSYAKALSLQR